MDNTCVSCGVLIPEGLQVCSVCESSIPNSDSRVSCQLCKHNTTNVLQKISLLRPCSCCTHNPKFSNMFEELKP